MNELGTTRRLVDMRPRVAGIYALHLCGEIVYVGQSDCIRSRIKSHMTEKVKDFDSYTFVDLYDALSTLTYLDGRIYLDWVEAYEIARLRPVLNRAFPEIFLIEMHMSPRLLALAKAGARVETHGAEEYQNLLKNWRVQP